MEKYIDLCCDKCTHSHQNPCKDFIRCCLEGPICHEDPLCVEKRKALITRVALNEDFVIF